MWQRIQTLYFAVVCGLLAAMIFGRMATITAADGVSAVRWLEVPAFAVLLITAALCNLVAMVSFKHRPLQIRLAAVSGVELICLQVWVAIRYFAAGPETAFKWTVIVPLVCAILDVLAIRGIYADELLVRSSSRLRSAKAKVTPRTHGKAKLDKTMKID